MNKNSTYLNEKLNELKKSVLQKNQQLTQQAQVSFNPNVGNDYYVNTKVNPIIPPP